jgi:hypothetical protein
MFKMHWILGVERRGADIRALMHLHCETRELSRRVTDTFSTRFSQLSPLCSSAPLCDDGLSVKEASSTLTFEICQPRKLTLEPFERVSSSSKEIGLLNSFTGCHNVLPGSWIPMYIF